MSKLFAKLIEPPRDYIPAERQMFSNPDLKALIVPLIIEQILVMFVAMATHWSFCSVTAYIRLKNGKWKDKKVI